MIRTKRVRYLSAKVIAAFTPHSTAEWKAMKPLRRQFYTRCKGLWVAWVQDAPLCVIGLAPGTFLSLNTEVFFLLCHGAQRHLKELVHFLRRAFRHMLRLFGRLVVTIEEGFTQGERFVRYFGFAPATEIKEIGSVRYRLYELRSSWL